MSQNTERLRAIPLELMKPNFETATSLPKISTLTTSMSRVLK